MSVGDPSAPASTAVTGVGQADLVPANPDYPVKLDVAYTPEASRIELLLRIFKVIPPVLYLFVMAFVFYYHQIVTVFTVLFTGKQPREAYEFRAKFLRFQQWVSAYQLMLTDEVPPMSLDEDSRSPVSVEISYTEEVPNWRALVPWWGVFWKIIPLWFVLIVAQWMTIVTFFTILFTGRRPEGPFRRVVLALRSVLRIFAYELLLTSERPRVRYDVELAG